MTLQRALLWAALGLAIVATLLGFGVDPFWTEGDPHVLGWVSASLACFYASHL